MDWSIRSQFLGLLVLVLLAYGIERLIVTDAEALQAVANDAAAALRDRDWDHLEGLLTVDFTHDGRDRAATVAYARTLVMRYRPVGVRIGLTEIQVQDDDAEARAIIEATVLGRPAGRAVHVRFRRTAGGWRLCEIEGDERRR